MLRMKMDGSYASVGKFCEDLTSAILLKLSAETGISRIQFFHEVHLGGWEKPEPQFRKRGNHPNPLQNDFQADVEIKEMNGYPYSIHGWVANVSVIKSGPGLNDPSETVEGQIFFCPKE
jgi:hypothetical protein